MKDMSLRSFVLDLRNIDGSKVARHVDLRTVGADVW